MGTDVRSRLSFSVEVLESRVKEALGTDRTDPRFGPSADGGNDAVAVSLTPLTSPSAFGERWCRLQAEARHSFFQSWGWVSCWLRHLPSEAQPYCLEARLQGRTAGLAILVGQRVRRRGVITSRTLSLLDSFASGLDTLTVEHNDFLLADRTAEQVRPAFISFLKGELEQGLWDEVLLPGIAPALVESARAVGARATILSEAPSHWVDLRGVRNGKGEFLSLLSAKRRYKIRRTRRHFESYGGLEVKRPRSRVEALLLFDRLVTAHRHYWLQFNKPCTFENPLVLRFHRCLIAERFDTGEIELADVCAGGESLGFLYCFKYRERAYGYQWAPTARGLSKTCASQVGILELMNTLLIERLAGEGLGAFDFLHGHQQFKQSLSLESDRRYWVALQNNRVRFKLENSLRQSKRKLDRGRRSQRSG